MKIEILEKALEIHQEKVRLGLVDQIWTTKLTISLSWISGLAVKQTVKVRPDGSFAYFYLWKDVPKVIIETRRKHLHALQELENEAVQSRSVRELIISDVGFKYIPTITELTEKDIVLGLMRKVHFLELRNMVSEADTRMLSPLMFTEHDRLHAILINTVFQAEPGNLAQFDKLSRAFLSGVSDYRYSNPALEEWGYRFLLYVMHENPTLLKSFMSQIDTSVTEMPLGLYNSFATFLGNRDKPGILKEEADLVYSEIISILKRGGF